jgi:hypothetical protein
LQPVISHKPSKFPLSTNYYDNECNCNSNPTTTRIRWTTSPLTWIGQKDYNYQL